MGVRAGGRLHASRLAPSPFSLLVSSSSTIGMLPVQAAARHTKSAPTARQSCAHQPNLATTRPTRPPRCSIVIGSSSSMEARPRRSARSLATFRRATSSRHTSRSTRPRPRNIDRYRDHARLRHRTASSSTTKQNLFDCASFSVGADPDSAGDPCLASTTQVLTVHVPDCGFQVDLIYGEPLVTMNIGDYRDQHLLDRRSASATARPPARRRRRLRPRPLRRRSRRATSSPTPGGRRPGPSQRRAPEVAVRWFRSRAPWR